MKRVFVSYRHVDPDQALAGAIVHHLKGHGHQIFVDTQMLIGTKWIDEIEQQIRLADYFIILLSKESIRSDMVRREVRLAYDRSRKVDRPLTILPVRVAFEGELPYDLGAYLDPIQYGVWRDGESHEVICSELKAAIENIAALPNMGKSIEEDPSRKGLQELASVTESVGAPLPKADPRLETGAMVLDSPFYVRRRADETLERLVTGDGTTTVIKGSRQIGKSSLVARAIAHAKSKGHQCCDVYFDLVGEMQLSGLNSLLDHMARRIARQLKITTKPDDTWDTKLGPIDNLTYYVEEAILPNVAKPIVLVLDDADRIFACPYRNDFFAFVRGWHNQRATNELWRHLNLVIAHSTDPFLWIQDLDRSPFNVGDVIKLEDFTPNQINQLNDAHHRPLKNRSDLDDLIALVGGHPYLIRQALYAMTTNSWSMPRLREVAPDEKIGPFGDHLKEWIGYLQHNKDLQGALRDVLTRGICQDESHFQRLRAAGLIVGSSRTNVQIRCRLYEQYFKAHL
jgi:hypothetical protein